MEPLIQRLLVCRYTCQISPNLVDEILNALNGAMPAAERRIVQWGLLRRAADLLVGSPWQRAEQLASIIAKWSGHGTDPIRALLVEAARTGLRLPSTPRGIYNILAR